ncbi:MAG: D-alanyl-D-alanine carboxypeptidase [Pseudomonadota bacterium]
MDIVTFVSKSRSSLVASRLLFFRSIPAVRGVWMKLAGVMAALVAGLAPLTAAQANSKYAAFVVHADSGDILFDRYSTQLRYPASLTKMMTLYLLFEEIEAGRLTLKSKLPVSKTAAAQPPSKLGVRRGSTIDVETAINALVVKSANDVAVVVAEKIGGSEWQFARKMTAKARALGMRRTTFRNASGLPHSKQRTTARDMAELSRRLFQDFPHYQHVFSTKSFRYKNRTYTTHNTLVKTYPGADGLKTGYTRLSGYNLATTAVRDEHRLIGIVLGGRSSYTRDKHMREILDAGFKTIKKNPALISALYLRPPTPSIKPSPFDDDPLLSTSPELVAALARGRQSFEGAYAGPASSAATQGQGSPLSGSVYGADGRASTDDLNRAQFDRLAQLISREDNSYRLAEGDTDTPSFVVPAAGRNLFSVQIGAYSSEDFALTQLENAAARAALTGVDRRVIPLQSGNKTALYRARFFFASEKTARAGCTTLKQNGIGCFVTNDLPDQF